MADSNVRFRNDNETCPDGYIETCLETLPFFALVMEKWGKYSESEVEAQVAAIEDWEIGTETLQNEGFCVLENLHYSIENSLYLRMVGDYKWVVLGYSASQMEDFAELLS